MGPRCAPSSPHNVPASFDLLSRPGGSPDRYRAAEVAGSVPLRTCAPVIIANPAILRPLPSSPTNLRRWVVSGPDTRMEADQTPSWRIGWRVNGRDRHQEGAPGAVHPRTHRARKPLLAINCAAVPESLLESELFGYRSSSSAVTSSRPSTGWPTAGEQRPGPWASARTPCGEALRPRRPPPQARTGLTGSREAGLCRPADRCTAVRVAKL